MLHFIRNIKFGWIIILLGLIGIISGFSMSSGHNTRTLLCFDNGCIYIQGVTNVIIGIMMFFVGLYMILKK